MHLPRAMAFLVLLTTTIASVGSGCLLEADPGEPDPARPADTVQAPWDPSDGSCEGQPRVEPAEQPAPPQPEDAPLVDAPGAETCPDGMVMVEGDYCPIVRQDCLQWLESPERFFYARCAEYEPFSLCLAQREHKRFCIDRYEYTAPREELPSSHRSWTAAQRICQAQGKRLCAESEWEFACEGEAMLPYPYGFVRDPQVCNFDRTDLFEPDGSLRDLREPSDARPACASPFGVVNMVGNLDEWTTREGTQLPHRSVLRGGWWMPARDRCRAATTAHDEIYEGPQTGFRCCASPVLREP